MAKVSLNQCLGQLTVPFLGRRLCFSHPWQFLLLLALFISCFSHQSVCLLCVLPSNLQFVLRCTCPFFLDVLPSCEMVSHCKEPVTFTRLHWRIFSFSSLLKNMFICGKCVSLGNLAILQTFDFLFFMLWESFTLVDILIVNERSFLYLFCLVQPLYLWLKYWTSCW